MRNEIPASYLPYDLYCNLIPNNDPNVQSYTQVPRTGAFAVSYKGHVSALTPCFTFFFSILAPLSPSRILASSS